MEESWEPPENSENRALRGTDGGNTVPHSNAYGSQPGALGSSEA